VVLLVQVAELGRVGTSPSRERVPRLFFGYNVVRDRPIQSLRQDVPGTNARQPMGVFLTYWNTSRLDL